MLQGFHAQVCFIASDRPFNVLSTEKNQHQCKLAIWGRANPPGSLPDHTVQIFQGII